MARKTKKAIAVIGDLIDSKKIKTRFEFQKRFVKQLETVDRWHAESPYTLTLGDEFQALYTNANGLFYDLFHIRECIYPVQCRFALSIGEITTPLNSKQAIGMDGPAFHHARDSIEHLKKTAHQLSMDGLPEERNELLHSAINILWASTENWNRNRLKILRMVHDQNWDKPEAYDLQISERAINKNIREGRLNDWSRLIFAAEKEINQVLNSKN